MDFDGKAGKLEKEAIARKALIKKRQEEEALRQEKMRAKTESDAQQRAKLSAEFTEGGTTARPAANSSGSSFIRRGGAPEMPHNGNINGNGSGGHKKVGVNINSGGGGSNSNNNSSASGKGEGAAASPSPASEPTGILTKGERVLYIKDNDSTVVTILDVHKDDYPNVYFTIRLPDGREKQTDSKYLSRRSGSSALL